MLHYYNDLEILVFAYIMVILFLCAVSALVLYIREKRQERKLERLHRRAVFERIKRERDEYRARLHRHENFNRLQRDIRGDYPTEAEARRNRTKELLRDVDELMEFDSLRSGAHGV